MVKEYFIYYGAIFIAAILAWLSQKFAKDKDNTFKLNKILFYLSLTVLLIIMGCRQSGVGVDDWQYKVIFNDVRENGVINVFCNLKIEIGYLIINRIVGLFTDNFQIFLFIISFISLLFFYKALEYERKNINYFLAFFLFGTMLYLYFFGIIRLFLAVGIVSYALRYLFENNKKKYIIFIIIASLFHYSALFMLIFLFFYLGKSKNMDRYHIIEFYVILVIALIFISAIISNFIAPSIQRYSGYTMKNFKIDLSDFDKVPIILLSLLFYKKIDNKNKKEMEFYIIFYSTAIVISIFDSLVNIGRIQWYLNYAVCIILPTLVRSIWLNRGNIKYKYINILLIPLIIVYGLIYSYRIVFVQTSNKNMKNYSNVLWK